MDEGKLTCYVQSRPPRPSRAFSCSPSARFVLFRPQSMSAEPADASCHADPAMAKTGRHGGSFEPPRPHTWQVHRSPPASLARSFFLFFCLFPALLFVRSVVAVNISTPVSARLSHSVSSARKAGGSTFPGCQMGILANIWLFTLSKESRW